MMPIELVAFAEKQIELYETAIKSKESYLESLKSEMIRTKSEILQIEGGIGALKLVIKHINEPPSETKSGNEQINE